MFLYFIPLYRERYPIILKEELIPLDDLSNTTDMVKKLSSLLELPAEECKDREAATAELHELLKKYYPNCLLAMFGSTVNGFGVKNCDLDLLFMPFPDYCNKDCPRSERVPPPDPESILSGETPRDDLYKLADWSHFKFLKMLLLKDKSIVKKVVMMPSKNHNFCLKIHLTKSKVICDLHMTNKLVTFNSELLQFLGKVDPRVKPLVMTLCFWSHSLGLAKRSIFSNYAFTLLIIFYLQNINPPILPSIQHLMDHAKFSRMSAGWQTAFATDMRLTKRSKNNQTLGELLLHFFEFYWNFDFAQNIVSPNSGKILPVKAVKDSTVEKMKEFEISSVNVQDPFVLSRNVCKLETDTPVTMFKFSCLIAQQLLKSIPEKHKFSSFFDLSEYQKILDFHYEKYVIGRPKVCFINLDYDCMSHLNKSSKFSQQLWYERVAQAVYEVLQYGLLIECEVTDKMNWGKNLTAVSMKENGWKSKMQEKMETSSESTPFDLELMQSVQCVVYSRTWMGRKKFAEVTLNAEDADDFNSSVLKTEHSVSRELIRNNPMLNRSVPLMCFKCDCYKHTCPQVSNVIVFFKPLTLSREFYQVSTFLSSYIPKTVKKIILAN